ncbi:hypothetical protein QFZ35_002977 [Arthrobacter ulcerisalmonis]|nr:hypothetical protein [Arthrobacter ulcerisalmonis]MDQ0732396.1 hypothetical protein [Arthrobacter sp. B1I2]
MALRQGTTAALGAAFRTRGSANSLKNTNRHATKE